MTKRGRSKCTTSCSALDTGRRDHQCGPLSDIREKVNVVDDHTPLAAAVPATSACDASATAAETSGSLEPISPVAASLGGRLSQNSPERQQPTATVAVETGPVNGRMAGLRSADASGEEWAQGTPPRGSSKVFRPLHIAALGAILIAGCLIVSRAGIVDAAVDEALSVSTLVPAAMVDIVGRHSSATTRQRGAGRERAIRIGDAGGGRCRDNVGDCPRCCT